MSGDRRGLDKRDPEHGPGPPFRSSLAPPDRETEIQQLRNELQICWGRIKGYETLGHLFQESKLECARYKQKNEELAKKLDNLTRGLSPSEPLNEPAAAAAAGAACANAYSASVFHLRDTHGRTGSSMSSPVRDTIGFDVGNGLHRPVALPIDSERQTSLNLKEVGATTPPTRPRGENSEASSASSPSFVQINSSYVGSPVSPLSTADTTNAEKQPNRSSVLPGASVRRTASEDLSSEVNRLAEQLKTVAQSGGVSPQDLVADLIRTGVNVMKLQKQTRTQQVLIDQMSAQINELQADIETKQRTIEILQKDCDTLRNTVKRTEIVHAQALQDAKDRYPETCNEQEDTTGEPTSVEWVDVASFGKAQAEGGVTDTQEPVVTAVPMVEIELRRRVEKLSATVAELVSANRSWNEHCRQLESSHNQQLATVQSKLDAAERRLVEYEQADEKRQQEFDNILLNLKKQREAEEMAKEEALNQLHLERQQRIDLEQKCIEFSRKAAELENRMMQPYLRQAELAQSGPRVVDPSRMAVETSASEFAFLQEQLRVFKEDFDQERRDRELTRTKMEMLQKKLKDKTELNNSIQLQLARTASELEAAKGERDTWRHRYITLSDELQALQRHARPLETRTSNSAPVPRDVTHTPTETPSQFRLARRPSWACTSCTFKNDGRRTSCEMCGKPKNQGFSQPNDTDVVDGRPVAGLQFSQSAKPHPSLVSRRLETDTQTTSNEPSA